MLQEDFYFTPEVYCTMTTSYGETIKAKAGEKVEFNTPEGEGFFTVDATYTTEADLRTVISLAGDLVFKYKLLDFEINAGIDVGPIDFDFAINRSGSRAGRQALARPGISKYRSTATPITSSSTPSASTRLRSPTRNSARSEARATAGP